MRSVHCVVAFLLLVALPFQAAIGATGWHCLTSTHHVHAIGGAFALHDHSADPSPNDVPVVGSTSPHLLGSGECSACSSCCFAAAVVPAISTASIGSYSSIKVSINVDAGVVSPALDGLFRPPRITTL